MNRTWSILFTLFLCPMAVRAQDRPMPPSEAAARMKVPDGFRVTLFAGEPDVVQPIAFTFDDRGRMWVAECLSYPNWQLTGRDRIVIFEDTDGDGRFDKRTLFNDQIANISGLVYGHGGIWVCATPNLLFIPDRNGDDVPDGPAEIVLDGWDMKKAQHNVFNGLTWGPDGWLYGCNGIQSQSLVGKPGTPAAERTPINCGVWRYHPTRKTFEVVATGTTNPWGLDFDDYGQMFITNCVIHHLWHVIPGSHLQRMYGQDFNPHWYSLMRSCADHIHWAGGAWTTSRGGLGAHSDMGGGHAHSGAMVYLGDNWPSAYRNGVFMCNLHGRRVNHDLLERRGPGYVAHHGKDFLFADDPWFRGLALQYGPDGGVYIADWSDTGECHNYQVAHKTSGRIFKVTFGKPAYQPADLAHSSDQQLVNLQRHRNDWQVRHARRLLQERWQAGKMKAESREQLLTMLRDERQVPQRLRALWALHVTGGLSEPQFLEILNDAPEELRAWGITLALEEMRPSLTIRDRLLRMAEQDMSAVVRSSLVSGLQRLPLDARWPLAHALVRHAETTQDENSLLLLWYGIEPLVATGSAEAIALLTQTRTSLLREYIGRRLVSLEGTGPKLLTQFLRQSTDSATQADVLRGMLAVLGTQRSVPAPPDWSAVAQKLATSKNVEVEEQATFLGALFDDTRALESLKQKLQAPSVDVESRRRALQLLVHKKNADLVPLLHDLLEDRALRGAVLRGLGAFASDQTPPVILKHYAKLTDEEKQDAIGTLSARTPFALALLDAVEHGPVAKKDLTPYTVRQMLALKSNEVTTRLNQVWGVIRPASQEKATLMARYKSLLTSDFLSSANRSRGRQLYAQACAACHRLFDEGGSIGPELTGGQRSSLDYWLENILDPSAVVPGEYQVTVIETRDGRLVHGMIKSENDKAVILQTQTDSVVIPKAEIESRAKSQLSLMPDGLVANLKDDEVRDLIGYLSGAGQVPLPSNKPK